MARFMPLAYVARWWERRGRGGFSCREADRRRRGRKTGIAQFSSADAGGIITQMLALRVDKWLRVGSGFVLLLFLVAQEKVCPWLVNPAGKAAPRPRATTADPTRQPTPEKRAKPSVPLLLADAPAPRWPASWAQTTLRQTTGARDGVVSRGPRDRATGHLAPLLAAVGDSLAWHRFQQPLAALDSILPLRDLCSPVDPAVRTCLCRTGPPRA